MKKERVEYGSTHRSDSFAKEAIAYAVGYTECWLRTFAEQHGLSFAEVADGLSSVLAGARDRTGLRVPQMREAPTRTAQVLQPKVALGRRARKSMHRPIKETFPMKRGRRRRKVPHQTVRAIRRGRSRGTTLSALAKQLGVSLSTVSRYQKAVA